MPQITRAIYLKRSAEAKFVLNMILVVALHWWALWHIPLKSGRTFQVCANILCDKDRERERERERERSVRV